MSVDASCAPDATKLDLRARIDAWLAEGQKTTV
jgi:hypothetical protein